LVSGCGLVAAAAMFVTVEMNPASLFLASVTVFPPVPVLACAGVLVAILPAVLAPPLPLSAQPAPAAPRRVEVAA
jgi:energy-coupling factor transport system permease protein